MTGRADRGRLRHAWVVYTTVLVLNGALLVAPLYPIYARLFGFSSLTTALIFATYAATLVPTLLIAGPLSDLIGRRPLLLVSIAAGLAGAVAFLAARDTAWLFVGRALQGVAVGAASAVATAAVTELLPGRDRRRAALIVSTATVFGTSPGPLLAGLLVQVAPAPRRLPFLVPMVLLVPAIVALARWVEPATAARLALADRPQPAEPVHRHRPAWVPHRPSVPRPMLGAFAGAAAIAFLGWTLGSLFQALVPALVGEILDTRNSALVGAVVSLHIVSGGVAQALRRSTPYRRTQGQSLALLIVGLGVLVATGETGSVVLMLLASLLTGAGVGMAFQSALAEVNVLAPDTRRGEVVSLLYVVMYGGSGLITITVGLMAVRIGLFPAFRLAAAFVVLMASMLLVRILLAARNGRIAAAAAAPTEVMSAAETPAVPH